ncbi:uncharacterized protein LOC126335823 [Schistocerca gregaria]|uniref:uncharacterized protein LOC126335823 n=1 Tax=Schistocerca gregaria TaxID=7010 RepID=UPI00211E4FAB|nr:uncharacterized protein LOC126335823 [Schistocerca gregaria]
MVQENEDGKKYFAGYEVSMLQLVAQIRGFPLKLTDDGTWLPAFGRLLSNGTWSGVAGELIAGHADLALGGLPVAICNLSPLECTTSYMQQGLVWFTPRPERLSGLHSVFSEAPAEVLLIMAALNAVISLVIWAASFNRGVREYSSYEDSCFATFSVSFSVPVKEPSVLSARVAFLSWILFSMAMEASLSSVITSRLSQPVFTRAITDDEDLLQSGLRGASLTPIAEFYPIFQKPGSINITEICTSFDDCARRIAYDRDVAVLAPDVGFKYIGRTKYRDELGAPLFTPLRDSVVSSPIAMVLAKGNPLAPVISDTILRIVEAGLLRYDGQPSASGVVTDANNDKEVLVFYFVIYFTMTVSWFVVLLGEISFKKWCHWRKRIKIGPSHEFYLQGTVGMRGGFNTPITFRV